MTKLHSDKELDWFRWHGLEQPIHHEVDFDPSKLEKIQATKWWMEGNVLHAETQFGPFTQTLPTDYICLGTNDKGLPILKKLDIT